VGAAGAARRRLPGIAPWLTPLAAVGLVLLMMAAAVTHLRLGEAQVIVVNAVLLILAAVVAWARFGPYSY
jgi:DoxX-like family